jgi:hypothetical protein
VSRRPEGSQELNPGSRNKGVFLEPITKSVLHATSDTSQNREDHMVQVARRDFGTRLYHDRRFLHGRSVDHAQRDAALPGFGKLD